jgi:hypothetical protein
MFQQLDGIPVKPFDDFNDSYIKSNDKAGDVVGLPTADGVDEAAVVCARISSSNYKSGGRSQTLLPTTYLTLGKDAYIEKALSFKRVHMYM